jgi:hypothetical protein
VNVFGQNADGDVVSGFIESTVGKEFVLCYKLEMTTPDKDIRVRASADGSM